MNNLTQEEKDLFLRFKERWSLDKVKNMTLEEYTGVGNIGKKGKKRDDFVYWIEYKLKDIGRFSSRGAERGKKSMGLFADKDGVHFNEKLGKNEKEVFEIVKADIIRMINFSQANQLEKIDSIKTLDSIYKWKIAFHYQNINDMNIVCIFNESVLQEIAKGENLDLGENPSTAEIYQKLLDDKTYTLETMVNEKSVPLWEKYKLKNNKEKEKMETSNQTNAKKASNNRQIPLNQILYGPPGTGKTYQTIDRALEILKYHEMIDNIPESRSEKKKIFDKYRENGQIAFITFHQSFSYEEFVEGIKPAIANEEGNEMTYKIHSGIFKELCANAMNVYKNSDHQNNHSHKEIDKTKDLYRLYTTSEDEDDYFQDCIEKNYVWAYPNYGGNEIKKENMKGNYIIIPDKSTKIRAFGIFGEKSEEKTEEARTKIYREVEWLWKKDSEQESLSIEGVNFGIPTFQRVHKYKDVVLNHLELIINKKMRPISSSLMKSIGGIFLRFLVS